MFYSESARRRHCGGLEWRDGTKLSYVNSFFHKEEIADFGAGFGRQGFNISGVIMISLFHVRVYRDQGKSATMTSRNQSCFFVEGIR